MSDEKPTQLQVNKAEVDRVMDACERVELLSPNDRTWWFGLMVQTLILKQGVISHSDVAALHMIAYCAKVKPECLRADPVKLARQALEMFEWFLHESAMWEKRPVWLEFR